jgi:hypothetical protein
MFLVNPMLMSGGPRVIGTDFTGYPSGQFPSDWSRPWVQGSWVVDESKHLAETAASLGRKVALWDILPAVSSGQVLARVASNDFSSSANVSLVGSTSGTEPARSGISLQLVHHSTLDYDITIQGWSNGSTYATNFVGPSNWAINTWYWARLYYTPTQYRFYMYSDAGALLFAEPNWLDMPGGITLPPGKAGVYCFSGALSSVDQFYWSPSLIQAIRIP